MQENMIIVDKYCFKHSIKSKNFVDFLINEGFIYRNNKDKIISNDESIAYFKNRKIYINEDFFYRYIDGNDNFTKIVLNENYKQPIHKIKSKKERMIQTINAAEKKILFIDFEFINNYYYEVGFEVFYKGKIINQGYFFETTAYNHSYMVEEGNFHKIRKIADKKETIKKKCANKYNFQDYKVENKNKINYILKSIVDEVDFIVAHQCESELKILRYNGIEIDTTKCICTATIMQEIQLFFDKKGNIKLLPSLSELVDFFNIKFDRSNFHFAFYDVVATRKVFFKIVELFNNKIENNIFDY